MPEESVAPPLSPSFVGRYELLFPIASGGMATVYLARQVGRNGFRRNVALKLTHPHLREDPTWSTELVEEAKLAARIRHPNVVAVLDVDDDRAGVFLVMEYIEGDTLAGLMRRAMRGGGVVPLPIAGRILLDSLAGLHAAHELRDDEGRPSEVVHRDFSPQNLLVGVDGVARLTDFGIARAVERVGFTRTGTVKGKFGYMSPEQVRDRPLDRRCDVWSAGVVAWEVLAGRRLFVGADQAAVILKVVSEPAPPIESVRASVPSAIGDAVLGALVAERDARVASAEAFAKALEEAFADSDVPIASQQEVAAYVAVTAADVLAERAERSRASSGISVARAEDRVAHVPDTTESVSVPFAAPTATSRVGSKKELRIGLALIAGGLALAVGAAGAAFAMRSPSRTALGTPAQEIVQAAAAPAASPSGPATPLPSVTPAVVSSAPAPRQEARPPLPARRSVVRAPPQPTASAKKPPLQPNPYDKTESP